MIPRALNSWVFTWIIADSTMVYISLYNGTHDLPITSGINKIPTIIALSLLKNLTQHVANDWHTIMTVDKYQPFFGIISGIDMPIFNIPRLPI